MRQMADVYSFYWFGFAPSFYLGRITLYTFLRVYSQLTLARNGNALLLIISMRDSKGRGLVEMRQVLIYPGEDGFWIAECPSLPGCISQGQTREEAVANVREAIDLYLRS